MSDSNQRPTGDDAAALRLRQGDGPPLVGQMLGPYRIVGVVGSGGMGEVYRARDERLGRDVAVKVIPASVVSSPDRLRRFEQEARATAALNHPNILSLYDIGEHLGHPYVVSELLEGHDLRRELAHGAVPIKKAIDWVTQICDGLAAAHDKGIVHRDLKPENLFITRDGRAKILDFGLAKLVQGAGEPGATIADTAPGVVMGTAAYMSPEQVRGHATDHRSDIFSLGVVIYELLTGNSAFKGPSAIETMSAILREDPPELPAMMPSPLVSIVQRCLDKSAERRFQSARDLGFALQVLSGGGSGSAVGAPGLGGPPAGDAATPAVGATRTRRLARWAAVAAGVLLCTIAGAWAGLTFFTRPAEPPVFTRLTFQRGYVSGARFTPDGQTVAYSASWNGNASDIYSMRVETPDARPLGLSNAHLFAISSEGEMAIAIDAFLGAIPGMGPRGTLARVPLGGGAPRVMLADVEDADWDPKGEQLAVSHVVNGVTRLEYPIGTVLYQTDGWIDSIRFSPAGDRIAFGEHPLRGDDRGGVVVVDLSGRKTVLASGFGQVDGVAWAPGGAEIWFCASAAFSADTIWAVPSSGGERRALMRSPAGCFLRDIASDGRVLLDNYTSRNEMLWREEGDPIVERSLTWLSDSFPADLSGDGKTLLFTEPALGANYQACLRSTSGSEVVRLGEGQAEALSSDGRWALATVLSTPPQLVLMPTGTGQAVRLPQVGLDYKRFAQFFPDSRQILFAASEAGRGTRLWVQQVTPPEQPRAITGEGVSLRGESISPDGRTVAAIAPDGRLALYPVDGGTPRPVAGAVPGEQLIRWSPDGRQLLVYTSSVPSIMSTIDLETGRKDRLREFRPSDATGASFMYAILLTADARAGVYSFQRTSSDLKLMTGLR